MIQILYIVGVLLLSSIGIHLIRTGHSKMTVFLSLTFFSTGLWNAFLLLSTIVEQENLKIWLHEMKYIGMTTMAVHMVLFTVYFTNLVSDMNWKKLFAFYLYPIVMILVVLSNPLHQLFRTALWVEYVGGIGVVFTKNSVLFYVMTISNYMMFAVSAIMAIYAIITSSKMQRKKYVSMLLAILVPFLANFVYIIFGLNDKTVDPTPIAMNATALLMLYAYKMDRSFIIGPIARNQIFMQIKQPIFVTNLEKQIVDMNALAEIVISRQLENVIGKYLLDVCPWIESDQSIELYGSIYKIVHGEVYNSKHRVYGYSYVLQDITEKEKYLKKMNYLSFHDGLTEVYNKHYLREWQKTAEESLFPIGLIYGDINSLKEINDQYGHEKGDWLIVQMVKEIQNLISEKSFIVRLGGDEFLIVIPFLLSDEELIKIAESIGDVKIQLNKITATISVGHAIYRSKEDSFSQKLSIADQMMYEMKKNKIRLF